MSLQNFFKFLKKTSVKERGRKPSARPEGLRRQFSLAELKAATNNFDADLKIGKGSFGPVYKGLIDGGSLVVAVKRLDRSARLGAECFQNEVELLCQLRQQNLVSLLGFCHEKDERILVYEYMTHRSLDDHLFGNADPLPWKRRLEICIGAARGLHYLHTGTKYTIIHRDAKPSNILLDENWEAKLSDFALSKIGPLNISKPKPNALTKTVSKIVGTIMYIPPEYRCHGVLSEKVDVYALGIVLLVVLCGRKAYDHAAEEKDVVSWIIKCIKNCCVHDIIDPFLKGKIAPVCLIEFVELALSCVYENPNERPSMGEVEVTLELALELQEKADLVIKAVNPHAVYAYEDLSFGVSVEKISYWPASSSSGESDAGSISDAELVSDGGASSVAES
ncbi:hypothetical protein SLA2020_329760 [Shorea laevis]